MENNYSPQDFYIIELCKGIYPNQSFDEVMNSIKEEFIQEEIVSESSSGLED